MESRSIGSSRDSLVYQREQTPEGLVFYLRGDLNLASIPMFWSNLKAALEDGNNVVVDLSGVEQIDQSGLAALEELHRLFLDAGQRFVIAAGPGVAQKWRHPQGPGLRTKVFPSSAAARLSLLSDVSNV